MSAEIIGINRDRRTLDEPAAVRFAPSGRPLALRWHGSIWQVVGTPTALSDGAPEAPRAPRVRSTGRPTGPAGVSGWRFTAQTGPASPVLEFSLRSDAGPEAWRLVGVRGTGD
ncbi:hypothetical protein FJV46_08430 [Arthrobacter agilis]|uniref:hypothetical protein n=1 Tax=Arthrobacter agilis TaxID=37921 RepID=UPI000B34E011|nr:hypothetical protein [Arthrobacter agilis]OUM43153.1 hypothetical protein B8W74_07955 [Arthrobacter agilis]PPB46097.1 hypothetical protein CI784_10155 [Arthrobacter agilis]TPV25639.1 hypothetical protein FJV46_08430 [Arthrobacter agilis]VDR33414.1 Uncharacterised protein [Arthrobacter agilis]